jgi:hypothetical protein
MVLVLELGLAPAAIALASIVARRRGPAVGGWLVGLPLTSGPVAVVLAVQQGPGFVERLAAGSLAGVAAQAAFAVAYARGCRAVAGGGWPPALLAATAAFATTATLMLALGLSPPALVAAALVSLPLALRAAPAQHAAPAVARRRADLAPRMALAAALVLAIATLAPLAGPRLAGVVTCFPVMGGLLAVLAHRDEGSAAAIAVCRGLLAGMLSLAGFAISLVALLTRLPIVAAFVVAGVAALAAQAAVVRAQPLTAPPSNPGRFVQPGAPSSRSASSTIRPSGPRT